VPNDYSIFTEEFTSIERMGHEHIDIVSGRWNVGTVCECGARADLAGVGDIPDDVYERLQLIMDTIIKHAPGCASQRCSPERPCPERNDEHVLLWGECYHRAAT